MTIDKAIALAQIVAKEQGWVWKEPVNAVKRRRWLGGTAYWEIVTNTKMIGMNVRIKIDDRTGEVIQQRYLPR